MKKKRYSQIILTWLTSVTRSNKKNMLTIQSRRPTSKRKHNNGMEMEKDLKRGSKKRYAVKKMLT